MAWMWWGLRSARHIGSTVGEKCFADVVVDEFITATDRERGGFTAKTAVSTTARNEQTIGE